MKKKKQDSTKTAAGEYTVIPEIEATAEVNRRPAYPWAWPPLVHVMVSNSFDVLGMDGMRARAQNGDPLGMAYAANFLRTLYSNGYVVAKRNEHPANEGK